MHMKSKTINITQLTHQNIESYFSYFKTKSQDHKHKEKRFVVSKLRISIQQRTTWIKLIDMWPLGECIAKFDANKLLPEIYKEFLGKKKRKDRNFQKRMGKKHEQKMYWRGNPNGWQHIKKHVKPLSNQRKTNCNSSEILFWICTQANIKLLDNPSCQWGCGHVDTPSCTAWGSGQKQPIYTDDSDSVYAYLVQGCISPAPAYESQEILIKSQTGMQEWAFVTEHCVTAHWRQSSAHCWGSSEQPLKTVDSLCLATQLDPKKQG